MNNNYYRWLYGDCGCGCQNNYRQIEDCDCEQILLDISNIHTDINVLQEEIDDVDLSNYYTKDEVDALIPSLSGYATKQWVENKNYLTNADMSDYALKSEIPVVPTNVSSFINDAGYLTDVDLNNYALKSEIPVVPTSNSAFTNDMHYITSAETYSKTEVNNIVNNKFWCGTQQEYDALVVKENGVLYLIYE